MSSSFLKKYKIIQKIGEGSFSEVLKCQDKISGGLYAAKRLKKTYLDTEIWDCTEVSTMRKITRHRNVLYVIEFLYDPLPGRVTLIFELMDMSLYDLLKGRKGQALPEQKVKLYLYQLLKGVEHLHKHGIFHRDIKPENVLIKGDFIKLADLGSIRGIFSKPPYTDYISTRWYRAPECLLTTGFYGPKMDVWASGCVFFELLTLKPLFPGQNEIDQIAKIHTVLGTPHARLVAKFRRHKPRNCSFFFPSKKGQGLLSLLPNVTETGRDVLRLMLIYDPEYRINVKRLLDHRYFNDLREESPRVSRSVTHANSPKDLKNPVLLTHMMSQKRRKLKPLNVCQSQIQRFSSSKIPRIAITADSNSRRNLSCEFSSSRMLKAMRNSIVYNCGNQFPKEWAPSHNYFPQKNSCSRINSVVRTEVSNLKLPNIECSSNNVLHRDSKKIVEKAAPLKSDQLRVSYCNLRKAKLASRYYSQGEDCKQKTEFRHLTYNSLPQEIKSDHRPVLPVDTRCQTRYGYRKNLQRINLQGRRMPEFSTKRSSFNIKSPFVKSPAKKMAKHEL